MTFCLILKRRKWNKITQSLLLSSLFRKTTDALFSFSLFLFFSFSLVLSFSLSLSLSRLVGWLVGWLKLFPCEESEPSRKACTPQKTTFSTERERERERERTSLFTREEEIPQQQQQQQQQPGRRRRRR